MRGLEVLAGGLAAALAGYGLIALALVSTAPDPAPAALPERSVLAVSKTVATPQEQIAWAPLFGTAAPDPPPKDTPPRIVSNYVLKGLVAAGKGTGWAIVADEQSETLLRPGDTMSGQETVVSISAQGVLIEKDGVQSLISFDNAERTLVAAAPADAVMEDSSIPAPARESLARPLSAVRIDVANFAGQKLGDIITRAGGIANTTTQDGQQALEILWVRNGLLYDKLGLRKGDKILTINGQSVVGIQNSASLASELLNAKKFDLTLMRAGVLRSLHIEAQIAT